MEHNRKKRLNHLADEPSPYLRQHADNPVNWYPWGKEAFEKAVKEDRPIFLSIGYSTCHWCHVMEQESFENLRIAEILNDNFISVKVDREERPDIDSIYMQAVQAMTGSGGWPLSVFLSPDRKPFYGGTYFPPEDRFGRTGFVKLLSAVAKAWQEDRSQLVESASKISSILDSQSEAEKMDINWQTLESTATSFMRIFDSTWGGFGSEPKFPQPCILSLLFRYWERSNDKKALEMAELTLKKMAKGGIYDHLGGGFHRYSTDSKWLVPHFEKMLYDQALITRAYIEAYQITSDNFYADVVKNVFEYVTTQMRSERGGFYSAEDADSEGMEGKFYIWKKDQLEQLLSSAQQKVFMERFGITSEGNFEQQTNILYIKSTKQQISDKLNIPFDKVDHLLNESMEILLAERNKRTRPAMDEKIITAWNGLMIASLAKGSVVFNEEKYLAYAKQAADFILDELIKDDRLMRYWYHGQACAEGVLDDYAFLISGLIELYQASFEPRYLNFAVDLAKQMLDNFSGNEEGGLYLTSAKSQELITRTIPRFDGAIPSGNSQAALVLYKLGHLTSDTDLLQRAENIISTFSSYLNNSGTALPEMMLAVDYHLGPVGELVISTKGHCAQSQKFLELYHSLFLPRTLLLYNNIEKCFAENENLKWIKAQVPVDDKATAYLCRDFVCRKPVFRVDQLEKILKH